MRSLLSNTVVPTTKPQAAARPVVVSLPTNTAMPVPSWADAIIERLDAEVSEEGEECERLEAAIQALQERVTQAEITAAVQRERADQLQIRVNELTALLNRPTTVTVPSPDVTIQPAKPDDRPMVLQVLRGADNLTRQIVVTRKE